MWFFFSKKFIYPKRKYFFINYIYINWPTKYFYNTISSRVSRISFLEASITFFLLCEIGHEDLKATDSRDADWLIVRCSEGFDGGLPLTNYELEVYSEENVYHVNTIYLNHTERSGSSGPVFEVPGLEPGRKYRLHLYAVNAKGRSDPVVLEPVTLKAVAMYTTGKFLECLFLSPAWKIWRMQL